MSSFGFVLGPGLPPLFLLLPVPFPCAPSASCVPWLLSWPCCGLGWALPDRGHGFYFFSWPVFGIFPAHPLGYAPRSHIELRLRGRLRRPWTHSPMHQSRCMHYSQGSPSWRNPNPKLRIEGINGGAAGIDYSWARQLGEFRERVGRRAGCGAHI